MNDPQVKSNGSTSSSLPLVIRVSKKSDSTITITTDEMTNSVILDTYVCGYCQSEFVDITEFIGHRLQHKSTQGSYRCELCKTAFFTQSLASEHYLHEHKVDITLHLNRHYPDSINRINDETDVIRVNVLPSLSDSNSTSQEETYSDNINGTSGIERVIDVTATADQQSDIEHTPPEGAVADEEAAVDDVQMLKFRLHREEVEGSKFKYGRYVYSCMYCDYRGHSLSPLITHSHNMHPNMLNSHPKEHNMDDTGSLGSVLTVEQYYAMHAKKKESKKNRIKVKRRCRKLPKCEQMGRIYTCHTCQKKFTRARSLRVHLEIHRTEKNFLCDECGKAFKSQIRLNAHRKVHREKFFQCSQCDFKSNVNTSIHIHRQFHRDGCVLCHVCGSAYTDKSTLKKHMQVHSLDRPYSCAFDGCTWRFKTQAMCKAHLRAHTSKGKFKCDICGYTFRHKHHLQRHQGNMHAKGASNPNAISYMDHPVPIEASSQLDIEEKSQMHIEEPHDMHHIHVEEASDDHIDHTECGGNIQVVPVQVVVATDIQGTPITLEHVDVNHLNSSNYNQVLIQTSEHSQIFSAGQE